MSDQPYLRSDGKTSAVPSPTEERIREIVREEIARAYFEEDITDLATSHEEQVLRRCGVNAR